LNPQTQYLSKKNPWLWIPSLYFAQGIPYVVVMSISVIMYKKLGISNTDIALYTSWLYLPWVIKPLWSPFVDMFSTKRFWIVAMQLFIGGALATVAFTIPLPNFFQITLAVFWLMAFSSATHDIAADGFYMLALEQHQQAAFVGVRSTFYRIAMITGQGVLVVLAGWLENSTGSISTGWAITFFVLAGIFIALLIYHKFVLPFPYSDKSIVQLGKVSIKQIGTLLLGIIIAINFFGLVFLGFSFILSFPGINEVFISVFSISGTVLALIVLLRTVVSRWVQKNDSIENSDQKYLLLKFVRTFTTFVKKTYFWRLLLFLICYRFAEAQLVKLVTPFLLDPRTQGGLGLTTQEVGIAYGTAGVIALTAGGLLGGYVISKQGLKFWLWIMVCAIHLPDAAYIFLSQLQPENFLIITSAVAVEQFGYGFGFTAYLLYMIMVSEGEHKTAHYAICTGIMALGMMLPGMFSGWLEDQIGYKNFFLWVMVSTIPGFVVAALIKIPEGFGKKTSS